MKQSLFNIIPAQQLTNDRLGYVVAGPPGTGKSTLLGSMEEVGKTLILCTLAREASSWKYKQHNTDIVPLWEEGWFTRASDGTLPKDVKVEAFLKFMDTVEALVDDEQYDCIGLDSGTELGELAWHHAMLPHGVIAPAYMSDGRSRYLPYETLSTNLDQAIKKLMSLTTAQGAKKPKHVGVSWHIQPPKEDTAVAGQVIQSTDRKGQGTEYEGTVLPMLRGGLRRKLYGAFPTVIFADIVFITKTGGIRIEQIPTYVLQVQPDLERHAKISTRMAAVKTIPNSFKDLVKLVTETKEAQVASATAGAAGSSRLR